MGETSEKVIMLPLGPSDAGSLRLILFATASEAGRGEPFWLLRRNPEASVYLGALIDAANSVHELLEIWVQRISGFAAAFPALARDWTSAYLDRKWQDMREDIAAADGPETLRLDIERAPLVPMLLNGSLGGFPQAEEWELCRDEGILATAGLPSFQGSLNRYLRNRKSGEWVALTSDAPFAGIARRFNDVFPDTICFNPEGGRIFCRPATVISWRNYADCLRGKRWQPFLPDDCLAVLPPIYRELASLWDENLRWRHFLLPQVGSEAGPNELFYLKLALLNGAVKAIAAATARRGAPFLNLTDAHFGVRLSDVGDALPALWTARAVLARGGGAEKVGPRSYLPDSSVTPGPFRIPGPHHSISLSGSFRIRKIGEATDGMACVEGTLKTDDLLEKGEFRLEIRFESVGGGLVIPGEITQEVSPGTYLFIGKITGWAKSALVEGATYPGVHAIFNPKLGSACDLYSLAILGLQLFIQTPERSLPMVCDDAIRLRNEIPPDVTPSSLPFALRKLAVNFDVFAPESENAPDELWWELISCIIRMLGGPSTAMYFSDASDGVEDAPEAIYHQVIADLTGLLRRARVRVLGEGARNREVRDEILTLMSELQLSSGKFAPGVS